MATVIKLDLEPPTAEARAKAAKELRETPDVVGPAIQELRRLVEEDKTLHYKTTDEILTRYLRPCKFYPDSAIKLIKREAEFKEKYQKILKNLMPDAMQSVMEAGAPVNVFAGRDQEGRRVLVQHGGSVWDTKKVTTDQIFQTIYLIHQAACLEDQTAINGVVVILDFKGMGMRQVANLTPSFAMLLLHFIQEVMPLRLKGVHIVNEPMIFKVVWKIFQPLIKEKLQKRLFFHGSNHAALQKHIDADHLPKDYGGNLPAINYSAKDWFPVLKSVESTIAENNTFGLVPKSEK